MKQREAPCINTILKRLMRLISLEKINGTTYSVSDDVNGQVNDVILRICKNKYASVNKCNELLKLQKDFMITLE